MSTSKDKKDITLFLVLIFLSIFSVYFLPQSLNKIFFLILVGLAAFSSKDYFWITYLLIILASPFRLFEDYSGDAIRRIPGYDIVGKYGLTFNEILFLVFLGKAWLKRKSYSFLLKNEYRFLLVFISYLWLISLSYGFTFDGLVVMIRRGMLFLTLFYSVPRLFDKEKIVFTLKIFVIFLILTVLNQITAAVTGFHVADALAGTEWVNRLLNLENEFLRAYEPIFIQFFTFLFGLVFIAMKKPLIDKKYAYLMVFLSYLSIFMAGLRGWFLAFSLALFTFFIFFEKRKSRWVILTLSVLLVLSFTFYLLPSFQTLLESNLQRFQTIFGIIQGEKTVYRLSFRLPRIMEGVVKNPIIGFGFSQRYLKYSDGHLGWPNLILQAGIVGLLASAFFWYRFVRMNLKADRVISTNNPYYGTVSILNLGLLVFLVLHSTSFSMWNIPLGTKHYLMLIMYLIFSDMWVKLATENNISY